MSVNVQEILRRNYGPEPRLTIATLGSHSALEICAGAKAHRQDFPTFVVAQRGRHKTYAEHYRTKASTPLLELYGAHDIIGCVDETIVLEHFRNILDDYIQEELRNRQAVFVPHRSFEVYIGDYDAIENDFAVPMFGNRRLLRYEEREQTPNQYDLLREAGIEYPRIFLRPEEISGVALVKVLDAPSGFRRAFFLARSPQHFWKTGKRLVQAGVIKQESLEKATIEEFVPGVQVNLNYFYSPILQRLEFMGPDTRRQTNLEGFLRLPADMQREALVGKEIKYEEAGHVAVTILESTLETVFELGGRFVAATKRVCPPGIIGPFALQCIVTPGPPLAFTVFDVSPRMPGSPGIAATPYAGYLWGRPVSMGERIAMELDAAQRAYRLGDVLT